ncbi:TPA: DUF2645 family protein, partial [Escherichia coli]|nr:DUF2645 family protein [Escherichia coli]
MSARMFVLCCIWFIVAFLWITITSALDKEWMIDGRGGFAPIFPDTCYH